MKIAFCSLDRYWHGLQNNGGSCTIIRAVRALRRLGHDAYIVTPTDKHTWLAHTTHKKIKRDTDVCIAVAISDIKPMLKKAPAGAMTAYWARPVELWQLKHPTMPLRLLQKVDKVFVNSEWQMDVLAEVSPTLIYQGIELDRWKDYNIRVWDRPRIGLLASSKKRKGFDNGAALLKRLAGDYNSAILTTERKLLKRRPDGTRNVAGCNLSGESLTAFYNTAHIWVATSTYEGLHNVPMEAALCGCILVCNAIPAGGTGDYCIDGETGFTYKQGDIKDCERIIRSISEPRPEMVQRAKDVIRRKIGTAEDNMKKLIATLNQGG